MRFKLDIPSPCKCFNQSVTSLHRDDSMNLMTSTKVKFVLTKVNFVNKSEFCRDKSEFCHNKSEFCHNKSELWILLTKLNFVMTKVNFVNKIEFCHDKSEFCCDKSDFCRQKWILSWQYIIIIVNFVLEIEFSRAAAATPAFYVPLRKKTSCLFGASSKERWPRLGGGGEDIFVPGKLFIFKGRRRIARRRAAEKDLEICQNKRKETEFPSGDCPI